jgi:hypothetical protein
MFAIALGVLAALSFLLAALDTTIGSLDLLMFGLAFWAAAWTASQRGI